MASRATKNLYKVQQRALTLSKGKRGFAYFMEMGLGKTRVVLAEFEDYAQRGLADILCVIPPRSLRGSWRAEAEELGYEYPVLVYDKDKEAQKFLRENKGPIVVLFHYELILGRGGDLLEQLLNQGRVYLALDESTRIKNHKSKNAKRLKALIKHRKDCFIRVLSGSPAPQGPHDLWNQFDICGIAPAPYMAFRNRYCRMGGWMGKQVIGSQNLDHLREVTGDSVFRAKKIDWTDLPSKLPAVTRDVEMTADQRTAYMELLHHFVTIWEEQTITVEMAVTAKNKLAQISSGFVYDNDKNVHWIVPHEENPKIKELDAYIEEKENKVIVAYHHQPTLESLEWWANEHGNEWKYVVLKSGMTDDQIEHAKKLFNEQDEYKVLLCQSSSHKYGHTLLGTETAPCHSTLFYENTYNLETRRQMEDRNHRHGQKYPVDYTDLAVSKEDRDTIRALQKKEKFENALLLEFELFRERSTQ